MLSLYASSFVLSFLKSHGRTGSSPSNSPDFLPAHFRSERKLSPTSFRSQVRGEARILKTSSDFFSPREKSVEYMLSTLEEILHPGSTARSARRHGASTPFMSSQTRLHPGCCSHCCLIVPKEGLAEGNFSCKREGTTGLPVKTFSFSTLIPYSSDV